MLGELFETPDAKNLNNDDPVEQIFHSGSVAKNSRELAYTDKFANFIQTHPDFLLKTKKAADALFDLPVDQPVPIQELDNVKIEYIDWHGKAERKYYKVTADDGQEFFLKVGVLSNKNSIHDENSAEDLLSMQKVKEALCGFTAFKVSAIDYQIGYKDNKRTYSLASFDERTRNSIGKQMNNLNDKIYKENNQNFVIQRLLKLSRTRYDLRKLYYASLYLPSVRTRTAEIVPRLEEIEKEIETVKNQIYEAASGHDTIEIVDSVLARDELSSKYLHLRSYLDSQELANDFHEDQMSYDKLTDEALVFDIRKGRYFDIEDAF
ncbi:MAG: hypothetical protein WC456_00520 [Patescibacteria group bacterium]